MKQPDNYQRLAEQRIVRQLALELIQSQLPTQWITFVDCLQVLSQLQRATSNAYQTEMLFELLFQQAQQLGRSAEWLAGEIAFETRALTTTDRSALALAELSQSQPVDDLALDTYSERLVRQLHNSAHYSFSSHYV